MCTFTCATTATATRQSAARTRANIVSSGSASSLVKPSAASPPNGHRVNTPRPQSEKDFRSRNTFFIRRRLFCPFCSTRWNQDGQDRRALDCRRDSCRVRVARFVLFFQYFMNLSASAFWGCFCSIRLHPASFITPGLFPALPFCSVGVQRARHCDRHGRVEPRERARSR